MQADVQRVLNERSWSIEDFPISHADLSELIRATEDGLVSRAASRKILQSMIEDGRSAKQIIEEDGHKQIDSESDLRAIIEPIIKSFPKEVERYRSGKTNLIGFFVGQVMRSTGGKADPKIVNRLIEDLLNS
jgi:aspartyl-tRNA(Asn)/glutamyl-tRNA(Gln) amidotransferase subunit B